MLFLKRIKFAVKGVLRPKLGQQRWAHHSASFRWAHAGEHGGHHQAWKQQFGSENSALWHLLKASKHGASPIGSFSSHGAFFQDLEKMIVKKVQKHKWHAHFHRNHIRSRPNYFTWKYAKHVMSHFTGVERSGRRAGRKWFIAHKTFCPSTGRCRKNAEKGNCARNMRLWMIERYKRDEQIRRSIHYAGMAPGQHRQFKPGCGRKMFMQALQSRRAVRKIARPLLSTQPQPCRPSRPNHPISVYPHRVSSNGLSASDKGRPKLHLLPRSRPPEAIKRLYSSTRLAPGSSSNVRHKRLVKTACLPLRRWLQRADLDTVSAVIRSSLSLLPLSLRGSILNLSARTRALAIGLVFAVPLLFLAAFLSAHSEQTPISERWRLSLLSGSEKQQIKEKFFANTPFADTLPNEVKWYHILRKVLDEEKAPTGSLLGARVLAPSSDWRIEWVSKEMRILEASLGRASNSINVNGLFIPQAQVPTPPASSSQAAYTLLVVDRPEANAFSFGWSPDSLSSASEGISPGVIVVYTGLLDDILGRKSVAPATVITPAQSNQLQVLLSHELSHLVLGHTLEFWVKQNYLWPRVRSLAVDTMRALLYPVTSSLGPFFNDAIFSSLSVLHFTPPSSASTSWALSCESQGMEIEADLVGLRLLAAASVDPHIALDFWERRLQQTRDEASAVHGQELHKSRVHLHPHSADSVSTRFSSGEQRTHPLDVKRVESIRKQLQSWERQGMLQGFSHV